MFEGEGNLLQSAKELSHFWIDDVAVSIKVIEILKIKDDRKQIWDRRGEVNHSSWTTTCIESLTIYLCKC